MNIDFNAIIKDFEAIPIRDFYENQNYDYSYIKYKRIGKGTARLVFDIGNGLVLKVSDTLYGNVQNFNEYMIYNIYFKLRPILCPVHWINNLELNECRFLVMSNAFTINIEAVSELIYSEEIYIQALKNIGLDERELELGMNSINGIIVDYGGTMDSEKIDLKSLNIEIDNYYNKTQKEYLNYAEAN
jgi:hypothetical protein